MKKYLLILSLAVASNSFIQSKPTSYFSKIKAALILALVTSARYISGNAINPDNQCPASLISQVRSMHVGTYAITAEGTRYDAFKTDLYFGQPNNIEYDPSRRYVDEFCYDGISCTEDNNKIVSCEFCRTDCSFTEEGWNQILKNKFEDDDTSYVFRAKTETLLQINKIRR